MFFLVAAGFALLFSVMCFARHGTLNARNSHNEYDSGGAFFMVFAAVIVLIGFFVSAGAWVSQIHSLEMLTQHKNVGTIYARKADDLTREFGAYLADQYPQHEREVFEDISPDKVMLYFTKYPELKASATLTELVSRINQLKSDVYHQQVLAEQVATEIRVRNRNPWFFGFMIPSE